MKEKLAQQVDIFKRGLKPKSIMESKIFRDAMANPDVPLNDVFEAQDIIRDREFHEWMKGMGTGTITAIGGLAVGIGIGTLINKL